MGGPNSPADNTITEALGTMADASSVSEMSENKKRLAGVRTIGLTK